jgi:DNA helicase-2/ATP-dependent DNA helicase PcrA
MTTPDFTTSTDEIDKPVDGEIARCLSLSSPRSFFLFAGAGSGKTRSLIRALKHIQIQDGATLQLKGQRVGVVTFTNAACDEIKRRIEFDPTIDVSTIHSFAWSLICGLNHDIREWLRTALAADIEELERDEARGRKGTKASATRLSQIASKQKRLGNLNSVKRFVYSPTSDNRGRDALNHSEVIKLCSHFLRSKPVMQSILVGRYPYLLIDESQDTNKDLVDALFTVQAAHRDVFVLGLIGDMMQRIYSDGMASLGQNLPSDWATPKKQLNYRCPKRIVALINKIRSATDGQLQTTPSGSIEGCVRLFILPNDTVDKPAAEHAIALSMVKPSQDEGWVEPGAYKSLTLEHRMAARRMGFLEMFVPLYEVETFRTGLLDGTLPVVRFFAEEVLPLVQAQERDDRFTVARIARQSSPLLSADALRTAEDQQAQLQLAAKAVDDLMSLWERDASPTLSEVLRNIAMSKLFSIPDILRPNAYRDEALEVTADPEEVEEVDRPTERAAAIDAFLAVPFSQIEPYAAYVSSVARFDTHQGVKGLEFDRVMVIMDDSEARGFTFKYENLFGGRDSGDPSVESTRRLFYVTCSRAKLSLALVAYTADPERVRRHVLSEGWFEANEIHMGVPA